MTPCPSCDRYMPQREATVWNADGAYCGGCEDKAMRLFCKDLVHEVLFEDEGERSAFFPRNYWFSEEQHYHAIAAE